MNSKEKIVLDKIKFYFLTVEEIGRLKLTLQNGGDFEGSITAKFSLDGGSRTNTFGSKVETNVVRKRYLEERINKLENELDQIDEAINYINEEEKEIIERTKKNMKLSDIARQLGYKKRKRAETVRNSAIKKIAKRVNF